MFAGFLWPLSTSRIKGVVRIMRETAEANADFSWGARFFIFSNILRKPTLSFLILATQHLVSCRESDLSGSSSSDGCGQPGFGHFFNNAR